MEHASFSLSWGTILTLAFTTGIFTAIINWVLEYCSIRMNKKEEATYIASTISSVLERFAISCAEAITNNDLTRQGHYDKYCLSIPNMDYPTDVNWKLLAPSLSARLHSLSNEILLSENIIRFFGEQSDPWDTSSYDEEAGKCGYLAWIIACDLRKEYDLPKFDPKQTSWDVEGSLKEQYDIVMKRKGVL